MRPIILISSLLLICSLASVAKEKSREQMIQEAQAAPLKEQPSLYIKIARNELQAADKFYSSGNPDSARAAVEHVAEYADKATEASIQSGNKLKNTEINIRKMADKLRDIKRNLNFDDQPPVQSAMDKLEDMRNKLLARMFGKKK